MNSDQGIRLQDPISIGDVLKNGKTFELNTLDYQEDTMDDLFQNYDDIDEEERKEIRSPWTRPFDELRDQMIQVSENLWKKIMQPGTGDLIPENCRVLLDFNAFFENKTESFDSTYLRGKPETIDCSSLPGIYKAVQTMRLNEEAQFLISYKDLFGELGCTPRIPPKADALYIMKVRSFSEMGDMNALDEMPESERNDFATVHKKALEVLKSGLEMFNKGNHGQAIRAFLKSARGLELCRLKDETEQTQQTATLIRLYTNLAVCYNKCEMYKKTCLITQDIKRLCDIQQKSKVLFCEGRAQRMLGNFRAARDALDQCQRLAPTDPAVAAELVKLNEQCKKYFKDKKNFSYKMLQNLNFVENPTNGKQPAKNDMGDADRETIEKFLTQFLISENQQLRLQDALTESEAESMRNVLVGPFESIELTTTYSGDRKIHTLIKRR